MEAAVQAVKGHPSTTFMAPYESLANAVLEAAVPLIREETRREILGDDLNPSSLVLDAQAYRRLRETITATMDDPDRWDRDAAEESILSDYVRWLADGKPARNDGRDVLA